MDSPAISRSGRVLKKSAKVKEMEDIDIADLESQVKARKKSKGMDDFDDYDDKKVNLKIPKISFNVSPPHSFGSSPPKKKLSDGGMHSMSKVPPFPSPVKSSKFEANRPMFQESSGSSSSETSSSSTSSSSDDESDIEMNQGRQQHHHPMPPTKIVAPQNIQRLPTPQEKVIVESYRQFNSPLTFVDQNSELAMFGSEEETSESNLVIAEESSDSRDLMKEKKGSASKRKAVRKPVSSRPPVLVKAKQVKKKPMLKDSRTPPRKKIDPSKEKKITAYMLWCSENRKRIVSQNPVLFSSISKKMGDIWSALPEKEKMAWRRKAKKLAQKGSSIISTGRPSEPAAKPVSSLMATEDALRTSLETIKTVGTSPIDVAAYLRLLGESLSIIGQRLTEHEGQIAVSGIFSVLLDSTLCALGPLLCLTAESKELDGCSQNTLGKMLDNIAYFMPGL